MALLMVHLLAARRWAQSREAYRDCPEFYFGAISPDAIHVRDHDDKSHKNEIHLNNWCSPHPDEVVAYWREHATPFDIGYGIHVLTDAQWVPRFRARLPEILLPDGSVNTKIYYNDTFVTDFQLYRERGGEALFDCIGQAEAPDDHPLLTREEFSEWRRMMVESYHGSCPKTQPVRYIDRAYVDDFLGDCQQLFDEVYGRYEDERSFEGHSGSKEHERI